MCLGDLGKLLHVASVAILAQRIVPKKRVADMRLMGLKPWDDEHMTEVDQINTDGSAFTIAIELWQIVFDPHMNCPPQCMGAQGLKCVLLPADRERYNQRAAPMFDRGFDDWDFLYAVECTFDCTRISKRPAILEMHDGEFMVNKMPTGLDHCFRLNPFMTGQDFFDMMVLEFGSSVKDWELKMGDETLDLKLSLLMSGIHLGFKGVDTPLSFGRSVG
jgi:hypothetical protein